jgi:uncharacterized protein DUF4159
MYHRPLAGAKARVYAGSVRSPSRRLTYLAAFAAVAFAARAVYGQCSTGTREATTAIDNAPYDGRFTFCRLAYQTGPGGYYYYRLPSWAHGYPTSDRSLMKILEGLTDIAKPHMDKTNVVAIGDPAMFNYPISYMTEAGYLTATDAEAKALHDYMLKGGFIIFDDFRPDFQRGNDGWRNFVDVMRRVMPEGKLMAVDSNNPIFHSFFEIPDPHSFVSCYDRGGPPEFWGMFENNDPAKRLMFIANFNNDISQYWEWSDTGLVPIDLSNDAYKFGVNYVMYGLTH